MNKIQQSEHLAVWSPRPNAPLRESLSHAITLYGLPVIQITPRPLTAQHKSQLEDADAWLFISHHSVTHLFKQGEPSLLSSYSAKKKIIAIGEKTAQALNNYALPTDVIAKSPYSSESLLETDEFKYLQYDNIAIVCGNKGRDTLANALINKEKKVYLIACYRRDKCDLSVQTMLEFMNKCSIAATLVTSCQIADAVQTALTSLNRAYFDHPLFALSHRIGDHLSSLGFNNIMVAPEATQQSLHQTIITWWNKR